MRACFFFFFVVFCSVAGSAGAEPLRVGYSAIAPYVSAGDDAQHPIGYEADVVRAVAEGLDKDVVWVTGKNVAESLAQLERGDVDVALGAISITGEREVRFDFTVPVVRDGLTILVKNDPTSTATALKSVFTPSRLAILGGFLLLIVVAGHLIWIAERGSPSFHRSYFPGVFEGMYFAIVTASTVGYGDKAPVRWVGRALSAVVIVVSLPMFAIFTAELASAITLQSVQTGIKSPQDLSGRRVAAERSTTGARWAAEQGAVVVAVDDLDDAVAALDKGDVAAVVYDASPLRMLVANAGQGHFTALPGTWDLHDVGFVVQSGSPLREAINRRLLALDDVGGLAKLRAQWFGREE